MHSNLNTLRKEIDGIDEEFIALLEKRQKTAQDIAIEKNNSGEKLENVEREREIICKAIERCTNPILKKHIKNLFEAIFAASKEEQFALIGEIEQNKEA